MKLLYVADNRNRSNWGCRATSIALSLMLRSRFGIDDVISGREVDLRSCDPTPIGSLLPIPIFRRLGERSGHRIVRGYLKLEARWGARWDYVTGDPLQSLDNLMRHRGRFPHLERIFRQVQQSEAVVINGEGTMIFQPERRKAVFLLMIIELAHRLGKPVFYVNAQVSDCPQTGRNEAMAEHARSAFRKCAAVVVRDPLSLQMVRELDTRIAVHFVPDALFSWYPRFGAGAYGRPPVGDHVIAMPEHDRFFGTLDFTRPYICLSASSGVETGQLPAAVEAYTRLAGRLKRLGREVYLVQTCPGGDRFLPAVAEAAGVALVPVNVPILAGGAVLAGADTYVSGRFHPSILASLGGTPCVFMGSNSHKTLALQHMLEYEQPREHPVVPSPAEVETMVEVAESRLREGEPLRQDIREAAERRCGETGRLLDILETGLDPQARARPRAARTR